MKKIVVLLAIALMAVGGYTQGITIKEENLSDTSLIANNDLQVGSRSMNPGSVREKAFRFFDDMVPYLVVDGPEGMIQLRQSPRFSYPRVVIQEEMMDLLIQAFVLHQSYMDSSLVREEMVKNRLEKMQALNKSMHHDLEMHEVITGSLTQSLERMESDMEEMRELVEREEKLLKKNERVRILRAVELGVVGTAMGFIVGWLIN